MSLFPRPQQGIRRTSSVVDGEVTTTSMDFTFTGSIHTVSAKDMTPRPDGRMDIGQVQVYTTENLVCGEEGGTLLGDLVIFDTKKYEIFKELPFQNGIIVHRKYVASLRNDL